MPLSPCVSGNSSLMAGRGNKILVSYNQDYAAVAALTQNTVTVDKGRIATVPARREGGTELYGGTWASRMFCAFINWLGCCMSSAEQDGGGIAAPFHEMFHKMFCMGYGCFCAVNFGRAAIQSGGLSFAVLLHTNISAWASLAEKGIVLIKAAFAKLTANPEQIKEELRKSANMYTNSHEIEDDDVDDDDEEHDDKETLIEGTAN